MKMLTVYLNRFVSSVVLFVGMICLSPDVFSQSEEKYATPPEASVKAGVPQGKVEGPFTLQSKIFPGTTRNYHLYIPNQHSSDKPACVMIVQDGIGRANEWRLPTVFDNLIAEGSMPVTIGIFVEPGIVPAPTEDAQPRFNRSFEYDSLGDRYAKFLIEELLPEVSTKVTLSQDPNDRALAGASSGAICAFNAAWERPDQFRRVLSTIGTYVGLRGANNLATLVRKTESKPLRVFLQDGNHDLNIYAGDWWMANQDMLSALQYANYDVHHVWGEGGHNGKHAAAIMPDALRWLWRDYPQPIVAGNNDRGRIKVLMENQGWEVAMDGLQFADGPAAGQDGSVYIADPVAGKIFQVASNGDSTLFRDDAQGVSGLMMGPDGFLYAALSGAKQIVRYSLDGKKEILAEDTTCNDLVVLSHGLYYTDSVGKCLWYIATDGKRSQVDTGIEMPNGIICSPDQTQLFVTDFKGQMLFVFQIQADGKLDHKQPYGYLHCPDTKSDCQADGMTMDVMGNIYVATNQGIQVLDPLGRVNLIIPKPQNAFLTNIVLAGEKRDTLFATCGNKVFRRKTQAIGSYSWEAPTKPPKPSL